MNSYFFLLNSYFKEIATTPSIANAIATPSPAKGNKLLSKCHLLVLILFFKLDTIVLAMSAKSKRIFKKTLAYSGSVFFALAAVAIYSQLAKYSWGEIQNAFLAIPPTAFLLAMLACACGYAVLATYDRLAMRYVGYRLSPWKWLLAGFLGFAITNNAGTAIVSGAAIRYRLYTRWKMPMSDILKMIIFSGFTYLNGCFFCIVLGFFLIPAEMRQQSVVTWAFWPCLAFFIVYYALAKFYRKKIHAFGTSFKMPTIPMVFRQTIVGTFDSIFASLVLYSLLSPVFQISYDVFLGVFVISQVLGVFTPVPGALGVFEGLFLFLLPGAEENASTVFGALIAYRIVYYLIPLAIAGVIMATMRIYSNWRKRKYNSII